MPTTRTTLPIPCSPVADIELPDEVEGLYDLAYNLWWSWNPKATRLFGEIDPAAWRRYRNPVQLLINVEPTSWGELLERDGFLSEYREVIQSFERYLEGAESAWFARHSPQHGDAKIAYISMEYGVHQSLAIYSGGLGVLSGDHAKSASDLGLPLVAVGLLYRSGYFHQTVDADGRQQHIYPEQDFNRLPLRPVVDRRGREVVVSVELPGRDLQVKVWVAEIGRVPLLLLDTDIPQNDPADRPITNTLYVRGREMRFLQEMVLGVAGVQALEALDIEPSVWHMNEGHCALTQVERWRRTVEEAGLDPQEALEAISDDTVFTTHTPVPAGNERFDPDLVQKYLGPWCARIGIPVNRLIDMGLASEEGPDRSFNLTALGLRTSRAANAVSRLNAEVTSEMWRNVAPDRGDGGPPVYAITNGIHTATWVGQEMRQLFTRAIGTDWEEQLLDEATWQAIHELSDEEIWAAHQAQKERLARFVRRRYRAQFARHGRSPDELRALSGLFDPEALTLGFARRFATYKRARLIFRDLDRLQEILSDSDRPVQLIFAGKAHPADHPGQELIRSIFQKSQSAGLQGRVFFLEDYDMRVGRKLVQGVDIWLNTPRRPMEASGTSGQKAAMNGVLNLSILDGWWPEGFDGENGWPIGRIEEDETNALSDEDQDAEDAEALYAILEEEIVPEFFDRDDSGVPVDWVRRMKSSIAEITPQFSASRMVRDYFELAYQTTLER